MSRSRKALAPPFVETDAEVIERGAVCIEAFTVRPVYRNKLRNEVDYLSELHFTSAPFLLCSFTLRDIDYSADKFNELVRRAQNRMSNDVNVLDAAVCMHDAV